MIFKLNCSVQVDNWTYFPNKNKYLSWSWEISLGMYEKNSTYLTINSMELLI